MTSPFDAKAATWDDEPRRRALAKDVAGAIARHVPLQAGQRLLDVGCGTGLIGLPLATRTGAVLGVDLSDAMVARFQEKARTAGLAQARGEVRDLVTAPLPAGSIEVAVSAMAFHHIPETAAMLRSIAGCLTPGGWLAIADLEAEDGSFHDDPVPHLGFEPEAMRTHLLDTGFAVVGIERVHVMRKPTTGREYPIFLAVARVPGSTAAPRS